MPYLEATNRIIEMLEAIPESRFTETGEFGGSLVHDPELAPNLPDTYGEETWRFCILSTRGATDMRHMNRGERRSLFDAYIHVFVPHMENRRLMDVLIWNYLYAEIREALMPASNWNRPASSIINLDPSRSEGFQAEAPDITTRGDRMLRILVAGDFTNQTS